MSTITARTLMLVALVAAVPVLAAAQAPVSAPIPAVQNQPPVAAPPVAQDPAPAPPVAQEPAPAPAPAPPVAPPATTPATALATTATTICGVPVGPPANLPPAGSAPVVYLIAPCFQAQGNVSTVDPATYLYYMELTRRPSQPSQNIWVPYTDETEAMMVADFKRLWATNFLDDLKIEVADYTFSNGVVGKLITYNMEERERVRVVNYGGSDQIDRTRIEEQLAERGLELRLDSFVDNANIARIKAMLREMMAEKGFPNAVITHELTPVAGGPKLVNVTFNVSEGPKIRIRRVDFTGNVARSDDTLRGKIKDNKPRGFLGFITGGGTWLEAKFEADAELIAEYYRNEGFARVRIGQPQLITLEDSTDGETRWVEVRIPVDEGPRYRVGEVSVAGNTIMRTDALRQMFALETGEWYNGKRIREGYIKARDLYGSVGYIEFTPNPEMRFSDDPNNPVPAALAGVDAPTVDVALGMVEGPQFLVNRITFIGNTTTRDNVIRRELRLVEGAVFNLESLKYSVRRLNQLGYFEQIDENDQQAIKYEKTEGRDNTFDVTLTLREQNRNQLTFGAGVSQFEGVFGQLSFQTANFMGRGESLTVSLQAGDRSQNYQLAFTEPFLFDRNITGGFDMYKRALQYVGYYTQKSTGGNLMFGFPVADFSRMFVTYAYEQIRMTDLNEAFINPNCIVSLEGCSEIRLDDLSTIDPDVLSSLRSNPFVFDSLLIGAGGRRTVSKVTPSFVHNTVDNPIFPNTGKRFNAAIDLAMLGGNTQFYKPTLEGIKFWRHTTRTSFGVRGQFQFIAPVGDTQTLPIFEKLFLGGEYSVRGFDIRSIGPADPVTGLVLGGNKSLLFNAEYSIAVGGPVRVIMFYDAGQVANDGDPFAMNQFKTSTGAEVRFMMPVLNVPFRLIFAANPQRSGVLDNNFQPAKEFTFRFAVGSTF